MLDVSKVDHSDGHAQVPKSEAVKPETVEFVGRTVSVVVIFKGSEVTKYDSRRASQRMVP